MTTLEILREIDDGDTDLNRVRELTSILRARLRSDEKQLKAAEELARAAQNICNRDTKESELATALAEFYSAGKEQE